jgi:uncharacterized protein
MSIEQNIQVVKDFFAAIGSGDKQALLALVAEDIEWTIPARTGRWPECIAGTQELRQRFASLPKKWK